MGLQNNKEDSFIKRISELIAANMKDEGFGVSELASELNMSRSSLHRRIKASTGLSVSRFIRNARLDKAMELLRESSSTISEIAFDVGFNSVAYFTRCFHDHFGYPPGDAGTMIRMLPAWRTFSGSEPGVGFLGKGFPRHFSFL